MSYPDNSSLIGKRVLVMGLGRFGGGVGVARWLVQQGAVVTVNDSAPAEELTESIEALAGLPITLKLGGHNVDDFVNADLIVVNPAVDRGKSDVLGAAVAQNISTTTEINLFLERCPAKTIGITGSVGKSTTTALIHAALLSGFRPSPSTHHETRSAKLETPRVFLGGNIGKSLLADLDAIHPQDYVILELSSFMLEETPKIQWSPHIAVITNIVPNHLDRHGTMAAYTAAKQNILRFQTPDDIAILNDDHDLVARWVSKAQGRVFGFTTRGPVKNRPQLLLPGEHNQSNAAAAVAVVDAVMAELDPAHSFDRSAALAAIGQFKGLNHRLQLVHSMELAGRVIRFYNDSKATTPEASITAVEAFPARSALFIVGGFERQTDYSTFEQALAQRAAAVLGIGATGGAIIDHLAALQPALSAVHMQTLEAAMDTAIAWAERNSDITAVVLSPASASWDQFANYEARGDQFATLARHVLNKPTT